MGHDKLRKFAENETFSCLLQPSAQELLADGYFHLRDHAVKGNWNDFFSRSQIGSSPRQTSGCAGPLPSDDGPLPLTMPRVARSAGGTADSAARNADVAARMEKDIVLELGCGKGEYTVALAERNPGKYYIGVDIKGARLWKGAKYVTERGIPNAAFLRTRIEFITAFFAPGEVSEIWLTFSDPQIRSENSRLSSPLFLERYRQFLRPGGIVHLKTDSRFLYEYTLAVCRVNGLRILAQTTDLYGMAGLEQAIPEEVREVQTFYEKMFLEQGYPICYLAFTIDHEGAYAHPRDPEDFDAEGWRAVEGPRLLFGHDSAETRRQKLHAAGE